MYMCIECGCFCKVDHMSCTKCNNEYCNDCANDHVREFDNICHICLSGYDDPESPKYRHALTHYKLFDHCDCFWCDVDKRVFSGLGETLWGPMPCEQLGENYNQNGNYTLVIGNDTRNDNSQYNDDWPTWDENAQCCLPKIIEGEKVPVFSAEDVQMWDICKQSEKWTDKTSRS